MSKLRACDFPYVFAYDICDDERRRQVLKCLKRWRVDGQYSVHETWLRTFQMHDLAVELTDLIDRKADSLFVCRLDQHKSEPVYQLLLKQSVSPLLGKPVPVPVPEQLPRGSYVVCYDIRERRRLQKIQRLTARHSIYLQRSVYLFRGKGGELIALLKRVRRVIDQDDDLRVYNLAHIRDMWFLSLDKPAIAEMNLNQDVVAEPSVWGRMLNWVRR
jgi:CRISPR-associated protein Cas2